MSVFDQVKVNNDAITGTPTGNPGRQDFATSKATMTERPEVDYDNHVSDGAMRTLTVNKLLYDSDGVTLLHYPHPDHDNLLTINLFLSNQHYH